MPQSTASMKKMLLSTQTKFATEVRNTLSKSKGDAFFRALEKLKASMPVSPEDVQKEMKKHFRWHPTLDNRVVGMDAQGGLLFRDSIRPASGATGQRQPTGFNKDMMSTLLEFLPYTVIGRLAKTCKWMNTTITTGQVDTALALAKELFGKTEVLIEPSSGRRMLRVFNRDRDMVEVGVIHRDSRVYMLRFQGVTYMGFYHVPSDLNRILNLGDNGDKGVTFQFCRFSVPTRECVSVSFYMVDRIMEYCNVHFHAFVM